MRIAYEAETLLEMKGRVVNNTMRQDNNAEPILFGRYRVEGTLGQGGFGTVTKAFDTSDLQRYVAIKTLRRDLVADASRFRQLQIRFRREATAGTRMGVHPNVVTVYDFITAPDGDLYLVLEYMAGGTLAQRLRAGPLPLREALRLAANVAQGLHAAHRAGIVHRDIKASNIFLAAGNEAKVGDFGIAQLADDPTRFEGSVGPHPGTPLYMSPEQRSWTMPLGPASDQYSLGLVLFEMLTGAVYHGVPAEEAIARLKAQPRPVRELVERLLALAPEGRFTSVDVAAVEANRIAATLGQDSAPERYDGLTPFVGMLDGSNALPETERIPRQLLPATDPIRETERRTLGRRAAIVGIGAMIVAGSAGGIVYRVTKRDRIGALSPTGTPTDGAVAAAISGSPSAAVPATPTAATSIPAIPTTPTAAPTLAPTLAPTIPPTETPRAATVTPTVAPTTARPQGPAISWADSEQRISLSYPSQRWRETKLGTDANTPFGLESLASGDPLFFYVSEYARGTESPIQGLQGYKDRQLRNTDRTYVQDPIQPTQIGGAPAASMPYHWVLKNNSSARTGITWYVNGPDRQFVLETFADVSPLNPAFPQRDDVDTLIASVKVAQ